MCEKIETRPLCLSPRREAVLLALYRLARPTPYGLGWPPSIREIAHEVGLWSTGSVWLQLDNLSRLDLVHRPKRGPTGRLGVPRAWRPNYERLQYVTVAGVTTVSERLQAAVQ